MDRLDVRGHVLLFREGLITNGELNIVLLEIASEFGASEVVSALDRDTCAALAEFVATLPVDEAGWSCFKHVRSFFASPEAESAIIARDRRLARKGAEALRHFWLENGAGST